MTARQLSESVRRTVQGSTALLPGAPTATALIAAALLLGVLATSLVLDLALIGQAGLAALSIAAALHLVAAHRRGNRMTRSGRARSPREALQSTASASIVVAVLTSTWNGVRIDPLYVASGRWELPTIASDGLFLLGFGLLVLLTLTSGRRPRPASWILIPATLVAIPLLASLLSPFDSDLGGRLLANGAIDIIGRKGGNLEGFVNLEIALLVVPITVAWAARSREAVSLIAMLWLASATISSSVAILDLVGVTSIGELTGAIGFNGRETGFSGEANHLALGAALTMPIAVMGLLEAHGRARRTTFAAILAVLGVAIVFSGSRLGLVLALAAALFTASILRGQRGLRNMLVGLTVGLALAAVVGAIVPHGPETVIDRLPGSTESAQESGATRADLRELALDEFVQRPLFGVGYGAINEAHLIYLQLLHGGGVIALVAFLIFAGGALRTGWAASRPSRSGMGSRRLAQVLAASFVLFLIGGLASNALTDGYLYVSVGLLVALARQRETIGKDSSA